MNSLRLSLAARRRGAVTLEAILAIPVLVILLMAAMVYGTISTIHHAAISAVVEAAREGAKVPTTLGAVDGFRVADAVEETVETILRVHGLTVASGSGVMVIIEDSSGIVCRGEVLVPCPPATSVTDPAEVRVRVLIDFDAAPIPNLLSSYCIDFSGKRFDVCSLSLRDCID